MRQVLNRFADCEKKRILRECVLEAREQVLKERKKAEVPPKQKKVA